MIANNKNISIKKVINVSVLLKNLYTIGQKDVVLLPNLIIKNRD